MRILAGGNLLGVLTPLAIAAAVACVAALGWLAPADAHMRDIRYQSDYRTPTGEAVLVEIDAESLAEIGVWPWPRRIHGEVLDRLLDLGAAEVAFDIDFSTTSNEEDDALFEAALERAGGYAQLAGFRQLTHRDGGVAVNLPLERFRQHADVVAVNVATDGAGSIRHYPYAVTLNGVSYPTLSATLARVEGPADTTFAIDFAIDADKVDRISLVDVLAGRVPPERIENRQVVIGASALELRDILVVPRHGPLPGALIQILAAETLRLGRAPPQPGTLPVIAVVLLLGLAGALLRARLAEPRLLAAGIGLGAGIESAALALQMGPGLLLDTAAIQFSLAFILVAAVVREASEKRRLHLAAARERDHMQATLGQVIADNLDGVIVIDENGTIVAASRPARDLIGSGLVGARAANVLPPEFNACAAEADTASAHGLTECTIAGPDGRPRLIEGGATISLIADDRDTPGGRRVTCLTFRDITDKRASEQRIAYLGSHDESTGALTRQELVSRLSCAPFESGEVTIIVVGLGRFSHINEVLGHAVGDLVLKEAVRRMKRAGVRLIARLGGESFAAVLPRTLDSSEIGQFCGQLADAVGEPYEAGGHRTLVTCRLGVTTPRLSQTADPAAMLSHADMAQTAARTRAAGVFALYSPSMQARIRANRDIEIALREAIARRDLTLVYQPQVELATGRLTGAEALVRWRHPTLGDVPPARFVGIAEETGLGVELGAQVLEMACREAAAWPRELRLSVNVSALQFEFDDMPTRVHRVLADTGLTPERLDLEITEGAFLSGSAGVLESLASLRAMGVGIALDDFGTGYSSLSYLSNLPADKVKIDQSFVRKLPGDTRVAAVIETVLDLCMRLGKSVVAEGIETEEQQRWLASHGRITGQGYLFGRPMPAANLIARHTDQAAAADAA
jgi:diguanylate cyclase (GGDEF)-like protein